MNTIFNRNMTKFLNEEKTEEIERVGVKLPTELLRLFSEGLETVGECTYFKGRIGNLKNVIKDDFQDATGLECYINKINIDDYTDEECSIDDIIKLAVVSANTLKSQLLEKGGVFTIICSIQTDDYITASLRFHKQRENETWLNFDTLDSYEEAIFVCFVT